VLALENHARKCSIWIFMLLYADFVPMAGLEITFISSGAILVLKLLFLIAEGPYEGVRGEKVDRDESIRIGMFTPPLFEWTRCSEVYSWGAIHSRN